MPKDENQAAFDDVLRQLEQSQIALLAVTRQRDAALMLLNRRNQELFDDHASEK